VITIVPLALLEALAARAPTPTPLGTTKPGSNGTTNGYHPNSSSGEYQHRLMVERWLQDCGIEFRVKPQPDGRGRTVFVLKRCPFDESHGDPDSCIMQAPTGALSAQCFHNSCSGKGWQEFKAAIGKPAADHFDPPLTPKQNAAKKASSTATARIHGGGQAALTDLGNAERLVKRHGDNLRHCHPWKQWLHFNKRFWEKDQTGAITACAIETVRRIYAEAAKCPDPKARDLLLDHARRSESAKAIRALIDLARSLPGIPILHQALDRDPWLFNCRNGTLDLRSGRLRDHQRDDLITKICPVPYEPAAPCPTWEKFLSAIFPTDDDEPDVELIGFVQRLLGRCLSGDVSEQILPVFWGSGANGKSTLVNAILETIGSDFAMKANADLLMSSNRDRHPTELADLFGMRLVVASETHQGRRLNEALVKDLTGGEPIRARRMKENFWEFNPTHKVILLTNHKPRVAGRDEGIWRRLRLVPFQVCFWDPNDPDKEASQLPAHLQQDKQLCAKLRAERAGILAWLVRGCLHWQRQGLGLPHKVAVETKKYRDEEDVLARWIEETCQTGSTDYRQRSAQLYGSYKDWCERSGETYVMSQKLFGPALEEKGFGKKTSDGVWYLGIALRG
jgi:putative DNA primase/helicase